jgi:CRISPR-associated protein (TIGR03986 family)
VPKPVELRGTVDEVDAERRLVRVRIDDPTPTGFESTDGKRGRSLRSVSLRVRSRAPLPEVGDTGIFDVSRNDEGWFNVERVVKWDDSLADYRFVHPYNFVGLPADDVLRSALKRSLFERRVPVPHDRYEAGLHTGHIDCVLKTRTPWFIPHPEKMVVDPRNKHKTLGYFTLDEVAASNWQPNDPARDTSQPAIPASSLRGMIRSVFEAATLSCFSAFDGGRLDFRIGFSPDFVSQRTSTPRGRGKARFVPCRVIGRDDLAGGCTIQLLRGLFSKEEGDRRPPILPVGLIPFYFPGVIDRDTGLPGGTHVLGALSSGRRFAAALKRNPNSGRDDRYRYRPIRCAVPIHENTDPSTLLAKLNLQPGECLVFGYLHRTGPNIENKHDERLFFNGTADYNHPDSPLDSSRVAQRIRDFLRDDQPRLDVSPEVLEKTELTLAGYADRHGDAVKKLREDPEPNQPVPEPPYPSTFVAEKPQLARVKTGALLYALIEEQGSNPIVRGLYPVAIPRLSHENARLDLLRPDDFRHCGESADSHRLSDLRLCPACRCFGWVRDSEGKPLETDPGRIDAVAGHVRFSHGLLREGWGGPKDRRAEKVTLPILGSPKPTTTEFYLKPLAGYETNQRPSRWPPALQEVQPPLYLENEARLRGRKFYRRRPTTAPQSHNLAAGGLTRPPDDRNPKPGTRDSQNQTVHLLPQDMTFGFRVSFDNLRTEELGSLLFALTLRVPADWIPQTPVPATGVGLTASGPELWHMLGHGKPLGMGGCTIALERFHLDSFDPTDPKHRYARVPDFGALPPLKDTATQNDKDVASNHSDEYLKHFHETWDKAVAADARLGPVREHLVEMLRVLDPNVPIHYPPRWNDSLPQRVRHYESYSWFVANRRALRRDGIKRRPLNVLLPDPRDERNRPVTRLPLDPTGP